MKFPSIFVPKRTLVRASTRDNLTFDAAPMMPIDQHGNMRGRAFDHAYKTHDGRTVDSTGAFLVGELERLDQTLNMPLASVTWSRDIELREDVSLGDELSSFTLSTIAAAGNLGAGNGIRNGKAWIGKDTNAITGIALDIGPVGPMGAAGLSGDVMPSGAPTFPTMPSLERVREQFGPGRSGPDASDGPPREVQCHPHHRHTGRGTYRHRTVVQRHRQQP